MPLEIYPNLSKRDSLSKPIMTTCNIALIQHKCSNSITENIQRAEGYIVEASKRKANIICLQEMFSLPYFCQVQSPDFFQFSEAITGRTINHIQSLAKQLKVMIITPFFECENNKYYNSAAIISEKGTIMGLYRKTHIPQDPYFEEKYYFSVGNLGFPVWNTKWGKIGVLICWDQWFPEAARVVAKQGTHTIFYPSAIGNLENESKAMRFMWEKVQLGHAVSNLCYVATVNRVGKENHINFWGHSFLSNEKGEILIQADEQETIIMYSYQPSYIEKTRKIWPLWRDLKNHY